MNDMTDSKSTRRTVFTEERLPTGTPVTVERGDDTVTIRTDPNQLGPLSLSDLEHIRTHYPHLTQVCNELEECYARNDLQALLNERGTQVEEWDTSTLPDHLREAFHDWIARVDGRPVVVFPKGQPIRQRSAVARELFAALDRCAA